LKYDELEHLTNREKAALSEFVARLRKKYAGGSRLITMWTSSSPVSSKWSTVTSTALPGMREKWEQ